MSTLPTTPTPHDGTGTGTAFADDGAPTARDLVAEYARAVRAALDDLPPDTLDDLTDGLEADLLDALADPDAGPAGVVRHAQDVDRRFGPARAYADELRASAGLAPRAEAQGASARGGLRAAREAVRSLGTTALRRVEDSAVWGPVLVFVVALRPAWWVLRGWVIFSALTGFQDAVPGTLLAWLVLLAAVVVSAQWGRGRWRPRGLRWMLPVTSVLAVLLLQPAVASIAYPRVEYAAAPAPDMAHLWDGGGVVYVDGREAANLYVYDAQGALVPDAQVFDDRGAPVLVVTGDDEARPEVEIGDDEQTWQLAPALASSGRALWNVYPLHGTPVTWDDDADSPPLGREQVPPPPFDRAPNTVAGASGTADLVATDEPATSTTAPEATSDATPDTGSEATSEADPEQSAPETSAPSGKKHPKKAGRTTSDR